MAGIGDEPLLLLTGTGERRHHGGEALGKASDFARCRDGNWCGEILGGGDGLGRITEQNDWTYDASCQEPSNDGCEHRSRDSLCNQSANERLQDFVALAEGANGLDPAALVPGHRDQSIFLCINGDRTQDGALCGRGLVDRFDGDVHRGTGDADILRAVELHDLGRRGSFEEGRLRASVFVAKGFCWPT